MERLSFKEILQRDIKQTFINPEEFGEEHRVNGKRMNIVFDDIENVNREKKMKSHMDGIHVRQVFFFVAAEDFGAFPAQGGMVELDGQRYTVVEATDEAGIYGITLEQNRSHR